ncbi:LADA_0H03202g1_1 [Lachancea dasiensis]|uniref:RING-type E3 ubiquitin transferase (cysteine targeting) n=1 Tax=Lachancea dasiensis TaxID=1072105 RepID=A0A1G4K047_9SACH|nr:LADA_0H03202g1_1 [Lachancea dasiensis]
MPVSQFDSVALDNDLTNQIWTKFQKTILPRKHIGEIKLLLNTLIFLMTTKKIDQDRIATYGSSLTGTIFSTTKLRLFQTNVILPFLLPKLASKLLNHNTNFRVQILNKWTNIFNLLSLITFIQFIALESRPYLTFLHRIYGIKAILSNIPEGYTNSVSSSIEFQNTQLLYTSLLQLLANNVLRSSLLANILRRQKTKFTETTTDSNCPMCNTSPVVPYKSTCCERNYCYICIVKSMKYKVCQSCRSTSISGYSTYDGPKSFIKPRN